MLDQSPDTKGQNRASTRRVRPDSATSGPPRAGPGSPDTGRYPWGPPGAHHHYGLPTSRAEVVHSNPVSVTRACLITADTFGYKLRLLVLKPKQCVSKELDHRPASNFASQNKSGFCSCEDSLTSWNAKNVKFCYFLAAKRQNDRNFGAGTANPDKIAASAGPPGLIRTTRRPRRGRPRNPDTAGPKWHPGRESGQILAKPGKKCPDTTGPNPRRLSAGIL